MTDSLNYNIPGEISDALNERRLEKYSDFIHGARMMFALLCDKGYVDLNRDISKKEGHDIYEAAERNLIMSSMKGVHLFMQGAPVHFFNHKQDARGRLVSVSADFNKPI